jgi:hypothetical protein
LTSDPGRELNPRFSPDGKRVAFALTQAANDTRIVVQSVEDSTRQVIGEAAMLRLSPVFFPDGRRIAYWRANRDDCAVVEHDLATGAERTLVDCSLRPRSRIDLSPDGRWLVFSSATRPQYPSGCTLLEIATGRTRRSPRRSPAWATTCCRASVPMEAHRLLPRQRVAQQPLDRAPRRVPRAQGRVEARGPGLRRRVARKRRTAPRGRRLARIPRAQRARARHGRRRGSRARGGARFPDVGPRGEIVYENAVYTANVFRVAVGSEAPPEPLWHSTRYTNQPEFSPDGRRVAFSSNRDGFDAIHVADVGGESRRVAGSPSTAISVRTGRPTAVSSTRSARRCSARAATPGSGAHRRRRRRDPRALRLGATVNDVRETRDGRWLLWGELSGYAMRLMRAPGRRSLAGRAPAVAARVPLPGLGRSRRPCAAGHGDAHELPVIGPGVRAHCARHSAPELYHWTLGRARFSCARAASRAASRASTSPRAHDACRGDRAERFGHVARRLAGRSDAPRDREEGPPST